jgi:hypothetical protein
LKAFIADKVRDKVRDKGSWNQAHSSIENHPEIPEEPQYFQVCPTHAVGKV